MVTISSKTAKRFGTPLLALGVYAVYLLFFQMLMMSPAICLSAQAGSFAMHREQKETPHHSDSSGGDVLLLLKNDNVHQRGHEIIPHLNFTSIAVFVPFSFCENKINETVQSPSSMRLPDTAFALYRLLRTFLI